MKCTLILSGLLSAASLVSETSASAVVAQRHVPAHVQQGTSALSRRATPEAPNGYTPTAEDCPSTKPTIRDGTALSQNETDWLGLRRNQTLPVMQNLLAGMNITGFDVDSYFTNHQDNTSALPNIAIAVSGGGYRALMNGAGAIAAFDNRTAHNSTAAASLSGLLQSATYLAGLSGGGWLVGSLYTNNFTSVQAILDHDTSDSNSGSVWQFGNSIFEGPASGSIQLLDSLDYYTTIADEVGKKADAGYNTTITDYWGRALSFQLVNASDGGPSYTFSSIADATWFTDASVPLPFLVTDGRAPGQLLVGGNATVYEISPWELGTYDPTTFAFVPLRYIGTNFSAGVVVEGEQCIRGFDNAGYIMGTSSTLFNQFLLQLNTDTDFDIPSVLQNVLENVLTKVGRADDDIADYPNPFFGYNNDTSRISTSSMLTLVDGGEDLQNIPLAPLIQPIRNVDVIFAVDSSADTSDPAANWPNGTSLVATYERQFLDIANGTSFPSIPDQQTFVNLGLNNRPTFFGCDASNTSTTTPLIVYLPNAPYSAQSNVSTFDPSYNDTQRNSIINNGYDVVTMANGTRDANWPTCVGCAILSRSFNRTGTTVPDVCKTCFTNYCWNGTLNTTAANYTPSMLLDVKKSAGSSVSGAGMAGYLVIAAAVSWSVMI